MEVMLSRPGAFLPLVDDALGFCITVPCNFNYAIWSRTYRFNQVNTFSLVPFNFRFCFPSPFYSFMYF